MNRKVLVIAVAVMAAVILASSINTALAETFRSDFQFAGGVAVIDIPGQPRIRILACGMWASDFGRADFIQIAVDSTPTSTTPTMVTVSSYEDNPERSAFSASIGQSGVSQYIVKRWQIEIFRIGKTSFVLWTVPLKALATATTPEVVIPPGLLILKGYGEPLSGTLPPATSPNYAVKFGQGKWYLRYETTCYYNAEATLVCPRWRYCGPVGEAYTPTSVTERTWFWWDYMPTPP